MLAVTTELASEQPERPALAEKIAAVTVDLQSLGQSLRPGRSGAGQVGLVGEALQQAGPLSGRQAGGVPQGTGIQSRGLTVRAGPRRLNGCLRREPQYRLGIRGSFGMVRQPRQVRG